MFANNLIMSAEERFKDMIDGMVVKEIKFPNVIIYHKNGKYLICQDIKTGTCLISYRNIWSVFESEYGLNYQEVKELTTGILKQHIKYKVVTTLVKFFPLNMRLKQHIKYKVVTTE